MMRHKPSHDNHKIMTKRSLVNNDNNDLTKLTPKTQFLGDFHESRQFVNLHEMVPSESTRSHPKYQTRGKDTLVPSRRLIALVNNDPTFIEAQRHLGLFPQVAYKLVRDGGVTRAKQITDFILSLALETPYFQVDKYGQYDPSIEGQRDRARKMLINMVLTNKPILEKYAGPSYFKKWPKGA